MAGSDFAEDMDEHLGEGTDDRITIEGRYVVETTQPLPELARCPAYVAHDTLSSHSGTIALAPGALYPARANAQKMARLRSPHLLTVHALDETTGAVWLICDAPPGSTLAEAQNWSESAVLERVIEPIATVLHHYKEAGFTHRAIRPDNVFDPGSRFPVRLGPGLATPPAIFQPDRFESISSVICAPAARGNGTIADDVFSLGALAAWLLGGSMPYSGDQAGALTEERITKGSFAVLAGHLTLSPDVMSLLAAMLSDDPSARPAPRDLLNAADRKGFVARRQAVAAMPVQVGPVRVRTTRELAWYAARYQAEFTDLFRRGVLERWLSHELGLTQAAGRLGVMAKDSTASGDASLSPATMMEIIAILDPSLPMFWDGLWFWPDAIGTLSAAVASGASTFPVDLGAAIVAVVQGGRLSRFGQLTGITGQATSCQQVQLAAREATIDAPSDVVRLAYVLNPFQPCLSSRCIDQRFSVAWALLQWLNAGKNVDQTGIPGLLDPYMTTFLFACAHRNGLIEYFDDIAGKNSSAWASDLRLLAKLQRLYATGPLPGIARKLLPHLSPALKQWRSRTTRVRRSEALAVAADSGDLVQMFDLLNDVRAMAGDRDAWLAAKREAKALEMQQSNLVRQTAEISPRLRNEMFRVASAVGTVAAIVSLCLEVVL